MGLLRAVLQTETRAAPASSFAVGWDTWGGGSSAGETVNDQTALQVTTVWRCVFLLAGVVSTLPVHVFRSEEDARRPLGKPTWLREPSPGTLWSAWVTQLVVSVALHGEAFLDVARNAAGQPLDLRVIDPRRVEVEEGAYFDLGSRYTVDGKPFPSERMLHIPWITAPGRKRGLGPLRHQAEMIGLARAMDRYLAQFYGDGTTPSGVLQTDAELTKSQIEALSDSWEGRHRKRRKPAILAGGLKWTPTSAKPAEAEFLESRSMLISEVANIWGVPPHLVGGKSDAGTYQNVEQAGMIFLQFGLLPPLVRIEEALSSLLPRPQFVKFNVSGLERADLATRTASQVALVNARLLLPNEGRAMEDRPPLPGGDVVSQPPPMPPPMPPSEPTQSDVTGGGPSA